MPILKLYCNSKKWKDGVLGNFKQCHPKFATFITSFFTATLKSNLTFMNSYFLSLDRDGAIWIQLISIDFDDFSSPFALD